ncbi:MAG: DNA recombination protein RmuC, partial [Oscillospiraceae bacterium]
MNETLSVLLAAAGVAVLLTLVTIGLSARSQRMLSARLGEENDRLRQDLDRLMSATRQEMARTMQDAVSALGSALIDSQRRTGELQDKRLEELTRQLTERNDTLQKTVNERLAAVDKRFESFSVQSEQKLDNMRTTVEHRLTALQDDNGKRLEQMRQTVDEKLQKTLNDRLAQSFTQVSERLEQVYKGLGEMQTLAAGVGDLKKVLSNVKTRGMLGEIQLGAILEQILAPEQYAANVATRSGS